MIRSRALAAAVAASLCCAPALAARPRGALGRALALSDSDCSNLPGVWTGFVGAKPLYDE